MRPQFNRSLFRVPGLCAALCLVALLAAIAPATAAAHRHGPRHVSAGAVFGLPSTSGCLSHSRLTIQLRKIRGIDWTGGVVKVNGRRFKSIGRTDATLSLTLAGLPDGQVVVSIAVHAAGGLTVSAGRTYRTCTAKRKQPKSRPPGPSILVGPAAPATPSPPAGLAAGSYTGSFGSLYVAAGHLQDLTFSTVHLGCTPGGNRTDRLDVSEIALQADGSFNSVTTQQGVIDSSPATFTYTVTGIGSGTKVAGTAREDVTYVKGGIAYSCTSGTWAWSMSRESQGSLAGPPPSGSYTGSFGSLYVAADSSHLQDVSFSTVHLGCTPGGNPTDRLDVGEIPIEADGSFHSVTTAQGVFDNSPATFTYRFSGHFHGYSSSGTPRLAGMAREEITYVKGGTAYSCSSNDWSWGMNRESQGSQAGPPPSGSYAGSFGTLQVSPDHARLLAVSFPTFHLLCTPAGTRTNHFAIGEVAVQPDGSFSTAVTTTEPLSAGVVATVTYTLSGHFHGYDSSGHARIAGMARADMTYTEGGAAHTCSSNGWTWGMTRQNQ
jgi:hypothetical protein